MYSYRFVYILFFFFIKEIGSAQQLCLKMDSVKVYYLAWNLRTKVSIDEDGVRKFNDANYLKIKNLIDT